MRVIERAAYLLAAPAGVKERGAVLARVLAFVPWTVQETALDEPQRRVFEANTCNKLMVGRGSGDWSFKIAIFVSPHLGLSLSQSLASKFSLFGHPPSYFPLEAYSLRRSLQIPHNYRVNLRPDTLIQTVVGMNAVSHIFSPACHFFTDIFVLVALNISKHVWVPKDELADETRGQQNRFRMDFIKLWLVNLKEP